MKKKKGEEGRRGREEKRREKEKRKAKFPTSQHKEGSPRLINANMGSLIVTEYRYALETNFKTLR